MFTKTGVTIVQSPKCLQNQGRQSYKAHIKETTIHTYNHSITAIANRQTDRKTPTQVETDREKDQRERQERHRQYTEAARQTDRQTDRYSH